MKEYKGLIICKADFNSSGIRYTARTGEGILLRADTLNNIKWMIRTELYERDLYAAVRPAGR